MRKMIVDLVGNVLEGLALEEGQGLNSPDDESLTFEIVRG